MGNLELGLGLKPKAEPKAELLLLLTADVVVLRSLAWWNLNLGLSAVMVMVMRGVLWLREVLVWGLWTRRMSGNGSGSVRGIEIVVVEVEVALFGCV